MSSSLEAALPALYRAADEAAGRAQTKLLLTFKLNSGFLIAAAILALIDPQSSWLNVASAGLFLASLAVTVYAEHFALQRKWYQARALAESVKTVSWRFMMSAEPFEQSQATSNQVLLRSRLYELLNQNRGIGELLVGDASGGEQVTEQMLVIQSASYHERHETYLRDRIEEQRGWYQHKALLNQRGSSTFFWILVGAYAIAVLLLLVRIASPALVQLPIEGFAVAASSIIAWRHVRRFDELSSAYALTAHELGIIASSYRQVSDDQTLRSFVADAENAFSREHTQWTARRDH